MAGQALTVNLDTNVLVRLVAGDDPAQAAAAEAALDRADVVLCTLPMLCEVVWVLTKNYEFSTEEVVTVLKQILATKKIQAERSTIEFGISTLLAGSDFADGVIAEVGRRQGADIFLTFDVKAQRVIGGLGIPVANPD